MRDKDINLVQKLSRPNIVKICIILAILFFIPGLLISIILAFSFGGTLIGPMQYNLWDNYISDLGSVRFSPTPFILDSIAMITSILLIPILLYISEYLKAAPVRPNKKQTTNLKVSENLAKFFLFVGDIGLFGIGLFSEDRNFPPIRFHEIFSVVVWGGFALAALFIGIISLYKKTFFSQMLAIFMIFGPSIVSIIYTLGYINEWSFHIFFEWLMLFFIFIWLIFYCLNLIKQLNSEMEINKTST